MILLFAGCAPPPEPDPESLLVDLAYESSVDLYRALHFTVGDQLLWEMDPGDILSSTYVLPDDADPAYLETDGDVTLGWRVWNGADDEVDPDGWPRIWGWEVEVTIDALVLPSATVSGRGTWTIIREAYDYDYSSHEWDGTLHVSGVGDLPVVWTSFGTFDEMNRMSGTIADTDVEYEPKDPDVP